MKENIELKKEKNIKKSNASKTDKRLYVIIFITIIAILVGIGICFFMQSLEYKKYRQYEKKMNSYGFNRLYDNKSAKTSEKVTKSEAIKMAIGTCLNIFDIDGLAKEPTEDYQNAIWVLYAQDMDLVNATDLNKDTADNKAKYIEVIEYFANAKKEILKKDLTIENSKNLSDMDKYTVEQKSAIIDLLSNDILKAVEEKLNGNKYVFKGQLNEIIVNYIEKYDLFEDKIQTDTSKLPSNASDFAYISQNVEKEVYELGYVNNDSADFKLPKIAFSDLKEKYSQIINKVETYYNEILNVDYTTIEKEDFKKKISKLIITMAEDTDYEEYVNYVKTNQIKITGKALAQKPIIYYDGLNYRLRVKLEFDIENSLTDKNILFYDLVSNNNIKYDNKNYSITADVILVAAYGTGAYYTDTATLNTICAGNDAIGIYAETVN